MLVAQLILKREDVPVFYTVFEEHACAVMTFDKKDHWVLQGYIEEDQKEALSEKVKKLGENISFEALPDKDWVAENRSSFEPLEVGSFYICGGEEKPQTDKTVFQIDISSAFGSGSHETTRGCVKVLEGLSKTHSFSSVLDLGTGSGILSLVAGHLWNPEILATDIENDAVQVAESNFKNNGCVGVCVQADGFQHPCFQDKEFDLIVANILSGPLIQLRASIIEHLDKKGMIVLSGLLISQAKEVTQAYESQGVRLVLENQEGEWAVLVFERQCQDDGSGYRMTKNENYF